MTILLLRLLLISLPLILSSCKENPIKKIDDEIWEKVELFDELSIHYIKVINDRIFVSAENEMQRPETPNKGGLYMSEDGDTWIKLKSTSWFPGPITYSEGTYYWVADSFHISQDLLNWDAIVMRRTNGHISTQYPSDLSDIVFWEGKLYGNEAASETYFIENDSSFQRVSFNERFGGARRYYPISTREIIAIQSGGSLPYQDRPFIFRVPDGEYIQGDFVPEPENGISASTAFQEHNGELYIASNFPDIIRRYDNKRWVAITDTIPTTNYENELGGDVANWGMYISFLHDEMYVGTRLGGVFKWSTVSNEWIPIRDGLPLRLDPNGVIDDLYYMVEHFEAFNGSLFAGYGFFDASNDPTKVPVSKQGLYKLKIK